jgi:hypothetical protein
VSRTNEVAGLICNKSNTKSIERGIPMSFAEKLVEAFFNEYELQKIDDWWKKLRNKSDKAWSFRIAEFLRSLAQKMGYQMEYEISTDFSWYQEASTSPSVAVEHENVCSDDIYNDEVPKLLESNAPLKVLITYVQSGHEETNLLSKFKEIHTKRMHEPITKQMNEEFLFVISDYEINYSNWRGYIFYPTGMQKQIKSDKART